MDAKLHVVGSGTPNPTKERWGSCFVLEIPDEQIMIDCGPASTYKMIMMDLDPKNVNNLFFTHHHSDHDLDYPCFLLTRWETSIGIEENLNIYGPPPTELLTKRLIDLEIGAFSHDLIARTKHPLSLNAYQIRGGVLPRELPRYVARDISPGEVIKTKKAKVTSTLAEHVQPYLDSLAYKVEIDDLSIVFTGDTRPCESVVELANGVDYLVCICSGLQSDIEGTPEDDYQSGSIDAAMMAKEAGVANLMLVHEGYNLSDPLNLQEAIEGIKSIYDGNVIQTYELTTYNLKSR